MQRNKSAWGLVLPLLILYNWKEKHSDAISASNTFYVKALGLAHLLGGNEYSSIHQFLFQNKY